MLFKDSSRKKFHDILHKKSRVVYLKKPTWYYYLFLGVLTLIIFSVGFSAYLFIAKADIAKFYPTSCLGGWENPQNAEGKPDVRQGNSAEHFNENNSAVLQNSIAQIFCGGFESEVPEDELLDKQPEKILLSFSWAIKTDENLEEDALLTATSTVIATSTEGAFDPALPVIIQETTSTEQETSDMQQETSTSSSPTSFWKRFFYFANAEELVEEAESSTSTEAIIPVEPTSTSSPSLESQTAAGLSVLEEITPATSTPVELTATSTEETPITATTTPEELIATSTAEEPTDLSSQEAPNAFLEILYTLDGVNWQTLDKVNYENWQGLVLEMPNLSLTDLEKLQISVQGLSTVDPAPVVYLDGLWLEAEFKKKSQPEASISKKVKIDAKKVFKSLKKDFGAQEEPVFEININLGTSTPVTSTSTTSSLGTSTPSILSPATSSPATSSSPTSFWKKLFNIARANFHQPKITKIEFIGPDNKETGIDYVIQETEEGKISLRLFKTKRSFKPGKYLLKLEIINGDTIYATTQDFTWGVLAININKSIYLPQDQVYIQMGVLDDRGDTICDALLELKIKNPISQITILSTDDGAIQYSGECGANNITDVPDYFAYYEIPNEIGVYEMVLTAITKNGERTLKDLFEVRENVPFDIERIGPTRIYPLASYLMTIKIKANQDFNGEVVETLPDSFDVITYDKTLMQVVNNTKEIFWKVKWQKDNIYELKYRFDAPDISPEFYLLGPLELYGKTDLEDLIVFKETRSWQIASDLNDYIDPDGEGITQQCTPTPSGTHYTTVDNAVRQPSTDSITTDYINCTNNQKDFFQMETIAGATETTQIDVWIYHVEAQTNMFWRISLWNAAETTQYGTDQDVAYSGSDTWDSVSFTGLSLTQSQLDGLRIQHHCRKTAGSPTDCTLYETYGYVTYSSISLTFTVTTDNFPNLDPSSPVFATSTLSVDTNNSTGWNVTLSGDNQGSGSASTTMYLRASSCAGAIDYNTGLIDDTEWIPEAATTSAGNATSITSGDDILAFRVMTASGSVQFRADQWWGTDDTPFTNALWAGHASSTATDLRIGDSSVDSGGGAVLNTVQYYLDVPNSQQTGCYEGPLTYTAITN